MTPMILNTLAAAGAAVGIAFSSLTGADSIDAYGEQPLSGLSETEAASHALHVFMRADRNLDQKLDVDEFAALSIVTAELAHLNGFIAIGQWRRGANDFSACCRSGGAFSGPIIRVLMRLPRHTFYAFSGDDSHLDAGEYVTLQGAVFDQADLNGNGKLAKKELGVFAQRQAQLRVGV